MPGDAWQKKKKKPYGAAARRMREAALAAVPPSPDVTSDAALLEDLDARGFGAVQDGELPLEAVTAAVQAAAPGPVVGTFLGDVVYEADGKRYARAFRMNGTAVELVGEPEELTAALSESREAPLIEARPTGLLRPEQLNRTDNVIKDTVLITALSTNGSGKGGRRYSEAALRGIAERAEGMPAYLNHVAPADAFKPRPVQDLAGIHRNVRYFPHEGKILSDLHVAPHQSPIVFGLAEVLGGHIGNSLVSRGVVAMEGDTEVVKEILAVRSADLVSDPATTKGLFESRADDPDPLATIIQELREAITQPQPTKEEPMDLVAILAHLKDKPEQQALLAEHLGFVPKAEAQKLSEQAAGAVSEGEALRKQVAALTEEKTKTAASLLEAQTKLDGLEAKDALATKRAKILTVIEAHDLGKQFGKVKEVVSDRLKTLLEGMDEGEWTSVLDDRFASLKSVPGAPRPASGLKPEALLSEGNEPKPLTKDAYDQLARAVTG